MTQTQRISQRLFANHRSNLIVNSISGKMGWSLNCPLSFLQEIGILLEIEFSCRKTKLYFLHIRGGSLTFFPSIPGTNLCPRILYFSFQDGLKLTAQCERERQWSFSSVTAQRHSGQEGTFELCHFASDSDLG